jgi:hypothetical protein
MDDKNLKNDEELLEGDHDESLDLDDAFDDDLELNDEGMESIEENLDEYEGEDENAFFEEQDENY